ncbi:MAG: hypothetical protein B0D92_06700 [Spirochaeta sp. LUC14_002_19_P3]|nr:MAG: hypothetical protein B0D92_06700 [Spirochaeta sp. LUC14_002_19_P3]
MNEKRVPKAITENPPLTLYFNPYLPFSSTVEQVNALKFHAQISDESIRVALLELLANSIRAHREKQISSKVKLEIRRNKRCIAISLTDRGGGFSPKKPPPLAPSARNPRFGMGLNLAKKLLPTMNIRFYNAQNSFIPYTPGKTEGTHIDIVLELPLNGNIM